MQTTHASTKCLTGNDRVFRVTMLIITSLYRSSRSLEYSTQNIDNLLHNFRKINDSIAIVKLKSQNSEVFINTGHRLMPKTVNSIMLSKRMNVIQQGRMV